MGLQLRRRVGRIPAASGGEQAPMRVLLYSHDSQGLGHLRRNLALAHALAQHVPALTGRPVTGLLLTGLSAEAADLPDGFDVVSLPGVRKGDSGYAPRHIHVPMADLLDVRGHLLAAVVDSFRPDLVVIDRHAYGVDGELRQALADLRARRPDARVVLGLRDVLDDPDVAAREWRHLGDPLALRSTLDEIWVYGDANVHDLRVSGEVPAALRDLVRYTGYLSSGRRGRATLEEPSDPTIVTMVGGGSDGARLCRVAAAAPVPPGHRHLIVTGPHMSPADRRAVARASGPRTDVVDHVPDGLSTIRQASALISMAGYNTVTEVMSTNVPALLVPRETPRREQLIRARGLHRAAAVDICRQGDLTPDALGQWMRQAVRQSVSRAHLNRKGLAVVARRAAELTSPETSSLHAHRAEREQPPLEQTRIETREVSHVAG